jgi:putative tricarboxylic transport membrane protein
VPAGVAVAERCVGAVLLAIGVGTLWGGIQLGLTSADRPGAGLFAFVLGGALTVLTIVWIAQTARETDPAARGEAFPDRSGTVRIATIVLVQVVYVAILPVLGFQLATVLMLVALSVGTGGQSWKVAVPFAIALSAGLYFGFTHWLGVPLPASSIEALNAMGL